MEQVKILNSQWLPTFTKSYSFEILPAPVKYLGGLSSFTETAVIPWFLLGSTGGPPDMRILGLVKTRISRKSHCENQKVVIPYVHDFSLLCEIKITFAAKYLFTH